MKTKKNNFKKIYKNIIIYFCLFIIVLIVVIPIISVFLGSFKNSNEFYESGALELPKNIFNYKNYVLAFTKGKMGTGFLNTAIILVGSLILSIATGTMTAYVINRFRFKCRILLKNIFLVATLIPAITSQVITYRIVNAFNLVNTYWAAILLFGGTDIISIYIFIQFMDNISISLDESAKMDGANSYQIFFRIIFPMLYPALYTVLILKFVGIYNEFYIPLLYIPNVHMVSTALYNFTSSFGSSWEIICAGQIIVILPMLLMFLFLQKYIYSGITIGSIKE